jgi:hypothetical protein
MDKYNLGDAVKMFNCTSTEMNIEVFVKCSFRHKH